MFLNQHVLNRVSLPAEDWRQQIEIFSHFLFKFFRFNYQLLWEQQGQNAYFFPQVLTEIELLPFVISETNKHTYYKDPTLLNISHIELIDKIIIL